jgi:methylmalonyl-CoA/ethylmalonyl-CoA epimerase
MKVHELITKVRHLGVVVEDVEKSVALYKHLFDVDDRDIRILPESGTDVESRFAFIPLGGIDFELIQPISENFKNFLGNPAEGINHIAFVVEDIEKTVKLMQQKGVRLGHVTKDGIMDMGKSRVAYFNPEDTGGILIEFVEPKT